MTVAEVSSFQLETIEEFRPEIGVLLNLTPDHLDRHASFEEYAAAKMRMFENQLERDAAVLNADDPGSDAAHARRARTFTGSAGRSAWPKALSCATTRLFSAATARRSLLARRDEIPCAASTTSKMFWPPAPQLILPARSRPRSRPA